MIAGGKTTILDLEGILISVPAPVLLSPNRNHPPLPFNANEKKESHCKTKPINDDHEDDDNSYQGIKVQNYERHWAKPSGTILSFLWSSKPSLAKGP